jgi:acyl carrier protein
MMERVREIISEFLQIPSTEIGDDFSPEHTPVWSSMRHMEIIMTLEAEYDIRFEAEEIPKMIGFGLLCDRIQEKVSEKDNG